MSNPELFAPANLLETCQGLQELIAEAHPEHKHEAGTQALSILGEKVTYNGARNLEIRTLGAYALPDGLTMESDLWPVLSFGEMRLHGHLSRVAYTEIKDINCLAWMIVEPTIRETAESRTEVVAGADQTDAIALGVKGEPLRRPLYLPVGMIESVLIKG